VTVTVLLLAAFGPYLADGIRTEQVAVYGAFVLFGVGLQWMGKPSSPAVVLVVALLTAEVAIAAIGLVQLAPLPHLYLRGSALSGMDNLLLPVAVICTVSWLARAGQSEALVRRACSIIIVFALVNAGLAFLSVTTDTDPFLEMFWGSDGVPSTAAKAATNGRYSGIFNQPAEGGIFYSAALLAAIYRLRERPVLLAIAASFVSIGGILTISKVFLLAGLPIGVWQMFRTTGSRISRFIALGGVIGIAWGATATGVLPEWPGFDAVTGFLSPDGGGRGATYLYTAGRFGSESTLTPVIDTVLGKQAWFGYGAAGLGVAYDSGYLEALVMTGVVGLTCHLAVIATLGWTWQRRRSHVSRSTSRFSGGLLIIAIAGSVGVPALTANRVATVLWLLLTLLLLLPHSDRGTKDQRERELAVSLR
jgi:hypothetical protein